MKKTILLTAMGLFTIASLLVVGAKAVSADEWQEPPTDSRITAFTITPASTTLGATTDYTVSITTNTAISTYDVGGDVIGIPANLNVNYNGGCNTGIHGIDPWQNCNPNFTNASFAGNFAIRDPNANTEPNGIQFIILSSLSAGTTTFTITNVVNPVGGGGYYQGRITLMTPDVQPDEGEPWPETKSDRFLIGSVAFYGRVVKPDGNPLVIENGGIGVNVRTQDFSFNYGSGADQDGYFAIPATGFTAGTTYYIEINIPGGVQGFIAPDAIMRVYNGSSINLGTINLAVASKTITGTVIYDKGGAVTTAEVSAYKPNMGGGMNTYTDANGQYTLTVGPGDWELNIHAKWDPETNQQMNVDWTYNQPSKRVSFNNDNSTETKTINFTALKTNAKIKGRVLLPDGTTPLSGGWVDIRAGEGQGMGSGINGQNGRFNANVIAGTYKLSVNPDNMNPNLAKYYYPEVKVNVLENQTLDLGDLIMLEKTSSISGTVALKDEGTAVEGVMINCWARGGSGWGNTTTDSAGAWKIWLAPGQYECQVQTERNSVYIPVRTGGPPTIYDIKAKQHITGLDFEVRVADATLNVRIVDKDGNAISEVWGWAYAMVKGKSWSPENEFGSGIDRGTTSIPLLGGKTYQVGMHTGPESGYLLDKEVTVTISVGETKDVILTLIEPDAIITGFLKDQKGKLIKGVEAEINAQLAEEMGPGGGPGAHTRVNKDTGSYTLRVRGDQKYMINTWFQGSTDFLQTPPDPDPIYVPLNGKVTKVITALRADTYVDATLLDPDGKNVDWGFFWCSNRRWMEDKVKGDFEGGRVIDTGTDVKKGVGRLPLISGKYECGTGGGKELGTWMPPEMQEITVTSSSPASITFEFSKADATLTGTVTKDDGSKPKFGWCHAWQEKGGYSGAEVFDGSYSMPLNKGTWFVGCDSFMPGEEKFYRSPEEIITISTTGEVTKDFIVTKAGFDIPDGITQTIDVTTQNVINLPDGTIVSIPANALGTSGNATFIASPDTNLYFTSTDKPINFAWNFEALDANNQLIEEFNSMVTITIPYNEDLLVELGIDESNLLAKYFNETNQTWQLPDGITQDTTANTISIQVNHFTNFALTTSEKTGVATQVVEEGPYNLVATPMSAGGPQVGVFTKDGTMIASWFAYSSSLRMGLITEVADLDGNGSPEVITIPGTGFDAQLRIFDKNGNILTQFMAYPAGFRKGVKIAVYDLDGDGNMEIITVPAQSAAADVKVFSKDGNLIARFNAYGTGYNLGAGVAAIDLDGNGTGEIVTYPLSGSGQVRVFSKDGGTLAQFNTYGDGYRKGVHLTLADLDGNGTAEVITSTKDSAAHVKVFTKDGGLLAQFMGYATTFKGGARTFVGDVDGNGVKEIVVLPDTNGSAQARVFTKDGSLLSQFFAYPTNIKGSFSAVVADVDGDGASEISFGPEAGLGPQVRVFNRDGNALSQFFTLHPGYRGGINLSPIAQ